MDNFTVTPEMLVGRKARCCDNTPLVDSSSSLAFFTYNGPGSRQRAAMRLKGWA